jgi:hypothetical protein
VVAEDGGDEERSTGSGSISEYGAEPGDLAPPRPDAAAEPGPGTEADTRTGEAEPDAGADPNADGAVDGTAPDSAPEAARRGIPLTSGIGCAALLLPLTAVAGAILCFAAGILSAASGCSPNGSALCSANGPWLAFALPLFVSPLIAAGTAIGAVTVRRHRSTWLAVGYGVVFISVIVGLATASTGSN